MRSALFRSLTSAVLVLTSATTGSAPAYALRPERAGTEEIRAALAGTEELQPAEVIRPAAVDRLNLKAVVWDFDDTLWNGFPRDLEASEVSRWLGRDPSQVYGFMMDTNGLSWAERIAEMRKRDWQVPEDWKAAQDRFLQTLRNAIRDEKRTAPEHLVPGAAELLAAFHEAFFQASGKRRQAVATGGAADSRYQYADDLGIRKYFEFIRGGGRKGQTIADTLYNWWLAPNELAFISDSEPDIRTAKQAGVLAVGFAATPEIRRKLIAAGADVIIGRDYRAKDLILDTLKLRRPAATNAGTEEGGLQQLFVFGSDPVQVHRFHQAIRKFRPQIKVSSGTTLPRIAQVFGKPDLIPDAVILVDKDTVELKRHLENDGRLVQQVLGVSSADDDMVTDLLTGIFDDLDKAIETTIEQSVPLIQENIGSLQEGTVILPSPSRIAVRWKVEEVHSSSGEVQGITYSDQPIPDLMPRIYHRRSFYIRAESLFEQYPDARFIPSWTQAGTEEAVTPADVQQVLDNLRPKIHDAKKSKEKSARGWVREAQDVYKRLEDDLPLFKMATGNSSKDQEIKQRAAAFFKRANDLLALAPNAGAEEPIRLDDLKVGQKLISPDKQPYFVFQTGIREAVLLPVVTEGEDAGISLEAEGIVKISSDEQLEGWRSPPAAGAEELSWLARFTPPAIVAAAAGIAVAGDIALEEKAVPAAKVTLEKRKVTVKDLPEDLLKGRKAAFLLIENDQNAEPGIWYFQGKVPAGPWHFEVKDSVVEAVSRVDLRPKKTWIFLVKDAAAEKALRAAIKKLPGHTGEEGDSYVAFTPGRKDLPALLGNGELAGATGLVAFRVEADRLIQWVPSKKAGAEEKLKPGDVHLLILDDEEMVRDMARRLAERVVREAGISLSQIHVVGTADEALRVVEEFKPQFGILDRNVKDPAGRTGIDVAREAVKAGGPLTRMVLVSFLTTDEQVKEKDLELQPGGALAGFVEKPYRVDGPLSYYLQRFLEDRVEPPAAGAEESKKRKEFELVAAVWAVAARVSDESRLKGNPQASRTLSVRGLARWFGVPQKRVVELLAQRFSTEAKEGKVRIGPETFLNFKRPFLIPAGITESYSPNRFHHEVLAPLGTTERSAQDSRLRLNAGVEETQELMEARAELATAGMLQADARRTGDAGLQASAELAQRRAEIHISRLTPQSPTDAGPMLVQNSGTEEIQQTLNALDRRDTFLAPASFAAQPRPILLDASQNLNVRHVAQALSIMMDKDYYEAPEVEFRLVISRNWYDSLMAELSAINPNAAEKFLKPRVIVYDGITKTDDDARWQALGELARRFSYKDGLEMKAAGVLKIVDEVTPKLALELRAFFEAGGLNFVSAEAFNRLRAVLEAA